MSKFTQLAVVMAALLASPLAALADNEAANASPQRSSVALASEAAAEAAERAAKAISADQALKLDVRLNGLTSNVKAAEPITVAAN